MDKNLIQTIVEKYNFSEKQIKSVLELLEDNNTVPFIARYRKEATGGLDEVEIKQIDDEYRYMENLQREKKKLYIVLNNKECSLTNLRATSLNKRNCKELKIYIDHTNRKKTRATEAKRKGLEPLAQWLVQGKLDKKLKTKQKNFSMKKYLILKKHWKALKILSLNIFQIT